MGSRAALEHPRSIWVPPPERFAVQMALAPSSGPAFSDSAPASPSKRVPPGDVQTVSAAHSLRATMPSAAATQPPARLILPGLVLRLATLWPLPASGYRHQQTTKVPETFPPLSVSASPAPLSVAGPLINYVFTHSYARDNGFLLALCEKSRLVRCKQSRRFRRENCQEFRRRRRWSSGRAAPRRNVLGTFRSYRHSRSGHAGKHCT